MTVPAAPAAPVIEAKVAAGASVTGVAGVITWILVAWVPAFRSLPPALAQFLPYIVSCVLGAAAAYLAPHTPRP